MNGVCTVHVKTGAETGDGRDESNKSLQERLADAQNAQTAADAEAKAADIKQQHLSKQAAEQRKTLASKDKEGAAMRQQLDKAQQQVARCTQALQVRVRGSCFRSCAQHYGQGCRLLKTLCLPVLAG
jgi:chromosome segregation ATPase